MRRAILLCVAVAACGGAPKPAAVEQPPPPKHEPVVFGEWKALSFGSYLAPASPLASDGGFDVVWHFHACRAADKDWRALDARVVVVCINNLGMGTAPYWDAFADAARFGKLEAEVERAIAKDAGVASAHVATRTLVAWSAGYASVQQILAVDRYYASTSAVVLLDGLHAGYTRAPDGTPTKTPRLDTVGPILRFAEDAAAGKKTFVFTHSAVIPPDYASTTEMARALEQRLGMQSSSSDGDFPGAIDVADRGNSHVRGFEGGEAKDHIAQLHLVTTALTKWVLPKR